MKNERGVFLCNVCFFEKLMPHTHYLQVEFSTCK